MLTTSLFQLIIVCFSLGFHGKSERKMKGKKRREGEEDREVKEQKVEEISTEKRGMMLEDKRVRKYLNTWETDFPWLSFEVNNNKMYCKVFPQFPSLADITSSLYTGTGSFRKTTIQAHARSKSHHFYSKELWARENPEATPMGRVPRNMNSQIQEKLTKLFNTTCSTLWAKRIWHLQSLQSIK